MNDNISAEAKGLLKNRTHERVVDDDQRPALVCQLADVLNIGDHQRWVPGRLDVDHLGFGAHGPANGVFGTAISAIWKATNRELVTTFALFVIIFSLSVVPRSPLAT